MMHQLCGRSRLRDERGFTAPQLPVVALVAIIVFGVLTTVAAPAFFSQRDKALDTDAKESVRAAALAMETWALEHDGEYDLATTPDLERMEAALTEADLSLVWASTTGYQLTVESLSGNTFSIERNLGGLVRFVCDTAGEAGCPHDGVWS